MVTIEQRLILHLSIFLKAIQVIDWHYGDQLYLILSRLVHYQDQPWLRICFVDWLKYCQFSPAQCGYITQLLSHLVAV